MVHREAPSGDPVRVAAVHHLDGEGLNLEIDAGNLGIAILRMAARTLAEFSEADMAALAQLQPGGDQNTVNINAGMAFKLEEHTDGSAIIRAPAQHPAAAAQYRPSEGLNQMRRLFERDGLHLHRPGDAYSLLRMLEWGH